MLSSADATSAHAARTSGRETSPAANYFAQRFANALGCGDTDAADRMARSCACLVPDDSSLAALSLRLPTTDHSNTRASFGRMAQCLAPSDVTRVRQRIHRSIRANRPDLMPPHWMRDVMYETRALQAAIQESGLAAAREYLRKSNLTGSYRYMPRFRALRHFVLFNTESDYRSSFMQNCIMASKIKVAPQHIFEQDEHNALLDEITAQAQWTEQIDTILASDQLKRYPTRVEKKIRSGKIPHNGLSPLLSNLKDNIGISLKKFWNNQLSNNSISDLFGFPPEFAADVVANITLHANEILVGPVLGPHYHSGHQYDQAVFPLLSGVYYPKNIQKNDNTKAGYLEFGRPDFDLPFEPACVTHRPVAGDFIVFPAFAYHGVIPIDHAPRYSINVDVYLKPKNAASWSVSEFFADAT